LSICRAIVKRHGGSIDFETVIGEGTTFFFDIPKLATTTVDLEDFGAVDTALGCVLIVEDEPDIALLIRTLLREAGYDSDIASNSEEARNMVASRRYRGMTLDITLNGQDGISLLRELREHPNAGNYRSCWSRRSPRPLAAAPSSIVCTSLIGSPNRLIRSGF
jgi:CheY-like chemotaxis protein